MAVPEQIVAHPAVDLDGYVLQGQLYVPAASVRGFRGFYGVDETTDGAATPSHYAALAVAPHVPLTFAGAVIFYAVGTTGTQSLGMLPIPAAGNMQFITQVWSYGQQGTAIQMITFHLNNLVANGPTSTWALDLQTTDDRLFVWTFPQPIPASAAATQITLSTIFPAASLGRIDVGMIGFNRAI